ncbi:hypothetical protein RJ639_043978 [Escallonia herrerae]|uniref:Ultraviolet-B receptor UVR8 n=1 Tax=Escallonia herrerae TaxID=1293975 RepID=A0AA88WAU4_9ASTE|nr:hypothetical protein RJ639_043978 [Escallonia herrerae]
MEEAETTPSPGNLSRKVIDIAAGEAHTLTLAGDGSVYAWGRGTFGRLGTGSESDELLPVRVDFSPADGHEEKRLRKIVGISAGAYHSLALAGRGLVAMTDRFGAGVTISVSFIRKTFMSVLFPPCLLHLATRMFILDSDMDGQLGVNGNNSLLPRLLEGFLELGSPASFMDGSETKSKTPLKVSLVKAGGMMSLAIDTLGALWIWGNCPHQNSSSGKEGEFSLVSSSIPNPVWDFHGHSVVKVACGNEHIVALVSAGETHKGDDLICYTWGNNNHGQLGLGDKESRVNPEVVKSFNLESPWAVDEVACGAFHTALLAHKKRPSETLASVCWTFGLGDNGQLGHGTTRSTSFPEPVEELPHNVFLTSIDCGLFHTCVVSSAGDVWSWGMEKGLGLCPDASFTGTDAGDAISPLLIKCNGLYGPKFPEPVQIACGAAHTVLVADGGFKLWSWGRGWSGVLGNGKLVDSFTPSIVLWPPLTEDFKEEGLDTVGGDKTNVEKDHEEIIEAEKRLSVAMEEMTLLRSKLSVMEQYASILHGSIFGKPFEEQDIPISLRNLGNFDITKEWEDMLEASDRGKLVRLEMFYRNMLAGVKDKLMKKRIKEIVNECLSSSKKGK